MKIVKYILFIMILILSVIYIIELIDVNKLEDGSAILVQLPYITGENGIETFKSGMDVWVAVICSLSFGVFIGFIIALVQIISQQANIISLKSSNRKLKNELDDIRNTSLDDNIDLVDETDDIDDIYLEEISDINDEEKNE